MRARRCEVCGAWIITIRVDLGYLVSVDALPIRGTEVVDGYEQHPLYGWFYVTHKIGYRYRGYPIHRRHRCTPLPDWYKRGIRRLQHV